MSGDLGIKMHENPTFELGEDETGGPAFFWKNPGSARRSPAFGGRIIHQRKRKPSSSFSLNCILVAVIHRDEWKGLAKRTYDIMQITDAEGDILRKTPTD